MGALNLAITGATGYLGRAVVSEARARGHRVRALLRDARQAPHEWASDAGIVAQPGGLERLTATDLAGVDAVLHLAAAMSGDDAAQEHDTLAPMRALLAAMAGCHPVPRLVLASSMAVHGGMRQGDTVTETTPLEDQPQHRDAYARAKLAQESLARGHGAATCAAVAILRIGAIWGPGRLWNGHLGVGVGPVLIRMGSDGQIPLAHRDRAAGMVVRAAEVPLQGVQIAQVLDTDLPGRARYVAALRRGGWPRVVLPVGWPVMRALSLLGPLPGMPGLLRAPVQRARIMPLTYVSQADWLGDLPTQTFETAMSAALAAERKTHG
ncbi:NAD-dependent epimerase/dehydratase family protein [Hydrogenophaga sp.]|uniref:NAD-dependent epimerase/dehydratase family protein n=1 Tax=Hydrogenophaga sp. TaxID=1904254 RepID=UPI003F7023CD